MDYKVLYRKYRPLNFNELVGQDSIKKILINSISFNKIAHAYIFTGPRGTGKTSTAKIFAKTLNCLNNKDGISCDSCDQCLSFNDSPDIIEIDAASNNGVDEIRQLRDSVNVAPYSSKYKIYIIDEVHMLSNSAWNALLKTLEEPPKHVIFILATTEINKVPITVLSRCQRFDFNRISKSDMFEKLNDICKKENIEIEENALNSIIKMSDGCLRDSLSYLDKLSKYGILIDNELVEKTFGFIGENTFLELTTSLLNNNNNVISVIDKIESKGLSASKFINEYINYLFDLMKLKEYNEYKNNIYLFIKDLNDLIFNINNVIDPFILLKSLFLGNNYFPGNKLVENKLENDLNKKNEIKQEKNNFKADIKDNSKITSVLNVNKQARINNSFVGASKELKNNFINDFNSFNYKLSDDCNYNLLGYIKNIVINVVSNEYVLFSFDNINDVTIFNNNINELENVFNKLLKKKYKFYSVSSEEWNNIKKDYINNKDKYSYIDENNMVDCNKSLNECENIANNLFGSDIINIS